MATQDTEHCNSSGFSFMDVVITIAIILILVVVGFLVWRGFQENARDASVEQAANTVYTAAMVYQQDANPETVATDAVFEYNNSQIGQDIRIMADLQELSDDRIRVTAHIEGTDHIAIRETPARGQERNPWEDEDGNLAPPTGDTIINMTYQCDETKSGYLGIINIAQDTTVTLWETEDIAGTIEQLDYIAPPATFDARNSIRQEIVRSRLITQYGVDEGEQRFENIIQEDGQTAEAFSQANTIRNVSPLVHMRAGVEYSVSYDGSVETFAAPGHQANANADHSLADCLVSIDHFGNSTDLYNLVYMGGEKLQSVPKNLPPSVLSLRGAFENTVNFNDPNIQTWDMSNVVIMQSMFFNARNFNQDLENWNVSNVQNMRHMFYGAREFNNGDASGASNTPLTWTTSSLVDIGSIFSSATSFNQDISSWDVSNVVRSLNWNNNGILEDHNKPPALR